MRRSTEPRLLAPSDIAEEQRSALEHFLDTLQRHASETAAILTAYASPSEIIEAGHTACGAEEASLHCEILRASGPLFETAVDLEVEPDAETVIAMRRDITRAAREGASREQRRVVRIATFAGEMAGWLAGQEILDNLNPVSPPAAVIPVQFLEPAGLPESA